MVKKEDKREYLGNNGDIVKVVGIVQHLGKVGNRQTICLASLKVTKCDGSVEKCDHTWIQNNTNRQLNHKDVGKIVRMECMVEEYVKYNRTNNTKIVKKGLKLKCLI